MRSPVRRGGSRAWACFVFQGGGEYTGLVAVVSVAVASIGPGRISADDLWGLDMAGPGWALCAWSSAQGPADSSSARAIDAPNASILG